MEAVENARASRSGRAREEKDRGRWGVLLSAGGVIGAIAASACCVLPLALVSAGVTGAWMGNLVALQPYRPLFLALALGFLAAAFVFAYRKPTALACKEGESCATPPSRRITRIVLWIATGLFLLSVGFPYAAPLIF